MRWSAVCLQLFFFLLGDSTSMMWLIFTPVAVQAMCTAALDLYEESSIRVLGSVIADERCAKTVAYCSRTLCCCGFLLSHATLAPHD